MFRPRREHELERLDADGLLNHVVLARNVDQMSQARLGTRLLAYTLEPSIRRQVERKVPRDRVDDVVQIVFVRCMGLAFRGRSMGEFKALVRRVVLGAVADFTDENARRTRNERRLPDPGDEEWPPEPLVSQADVGVDAIALHDAIEKVSRRLSPNHQRVVQLAFFRGLGGREVASAISDMSAANAHQIVSRFRADLRDELRGAA